MLLGWPLATALEGQRYVQQLTGREDRAPLTLGSRNVTRLSCHVSLYMIVPASYGYVRYSVTRTVRGTVRRMRCAYHGSPVRRTRGFGSDVS